MGIMRVSLVVVTLVCALATKASAQPSREPEAEALFDQGKELMSAGDHVGACQKFDASNRLVPRATTLMNLGACLEAQQKLVSAWYRFVEAQNKASVSSDAKERAMERPSKLKAEALKPRLSTIEIIVSAEARVPDLVVTRDGAIIVDGQWNSRIPIDGGKYTIAARARGREDWTSTIVVKSEGNHEPVTIPVLRPAAAPPVTDPAVTDTDPAVTTADPSAHAGPIDEDADPPAPDRPPSGFTGLRKGAVGLAVVGVAAIAGGAVFGIQAKNTQADADELCPGTECTDPEAVRLNDDAKASAKTANLLYLGGGVALGAGVALWLLGAPKHSEGVAITPHVGADLVGVTFQAGF